MNDYFFELPELTLPFSADELFDENDIHVIKSEYSKLSIIQEGRFFNTTNCGWTISGLIDPGQAELSKNNIVDYTKDPFFNKTRVGRNIGTVRSKKYQRILWEYINDTFHPDFVSPLVDMNGKKTLAASILCTKPNLNNNLSSWHFEGSRPMFPKEINAARQELMVNFKLYGDNTEETTGVQFATASDELEEYVNRTYSNIVYDNFSPKIFNRPEDDVALSVTADQFDGEANWPGHFTTVAEHNGYNNPFCINVSTWHRVYNSTTPRCTLRLPGNKQHKFEYYRNLHLEGKFIR